ncbi:hypothetical protein [Noviherbaspirillum agri]
MPQSISLNIGNRRCNIPAMQFVAGWLTLFEYGRPECESDEDVPLERRWLSIFASRGEANLGHIRFACVETLCRILGDAADWSLDRDSGFFDRNRHIVLRTSSTSACLTAEVTREWQSFSAEKKSELGESVDGMIFPCLIAHGQSQE